MSLFRVLLVEDENDILKLMTLHLRREGYEVISAEDGERGLKLAREESFHLAVVDWMLPGRSGLELCKEIAGEIPILMVTARTDPADIVRGLDSGADDYVTKPFEIPVFLARVRALLRRGQNKPQGEQAGGWGHLGELQVYPERHEVWMGQQQLHLTVSEFKLLLALLRNRGKVLSRSRLIELVQGEDVNVTSRTIDTHIFGLRRKLGASADLVETIRGVGYRVKEE
jgi:two-component system phosphate regulon response regulator PhoB